MSISLPLWRIFTVNQKKEEFCIAALYFHTQAVPEKVFKMCYMIEIQVMNNEILTF